MLPWQAFTGLKTLRTGITALPITAGNTREARRRRINSPRSLSPDTLRKAVNDVWDK